MRNCAYLIVLHIAVFVPVPLIEEMVFKNGLFKTETKEGRIYKAEKTIVLFL